MNRKLFEQAYSPPREADLSQLRQAHRRKPKLNAVCKRSQKWKPAFREVPLPLGEDAAKRRVRAKSALIRPFGPPSPGGRRTRPASFLLSWTPLPREEGWTRRQEKYREASFVGADGVVAHTETFFVSDHPVCAAKVASRFFLNGAATPPYKGG